MVYSEYMLYILAHKLLRILFLNDETHREMQH